jgi:hypothetical protein
MKEKKDEERRKTKEWMKPNRIEEYRKKVESERKTEED